MTIDQVKEGDVLSSTDRHGTTFVRVLKVCKVKIRVRSETGAVFLAYPSTYDRKMSAAAVDQLRSQGVRV